MIRRLVSALLLVGLFMLLPAAGCNKAAPAPVISPGAPTMPAASPAPAVAPADVPAQFAAARRTFDTHCQKCHTTQAGAGNMGFPARPGADQGPPQDKKLGGFGGGPGGGPPGFGGPGGFKGGMTKGPNLAKVGADPRHTREWLISFIRDPRSQKENARMPKFDGKISDEELGALADYLESLK